MTTLVCDRCNTPCTDQHPDLCRVFGVENRRLVATGFVLYDITQDCDVPEFDSCPRTDCPGVLA